MTRSTFSSTGLNLGKNDVNMTYLYGLSDFFSVLFEDTSKVNLLLESGAEAASAVYSNFLQLTSSISLKGIQNTLNQTLKLVTVRSTDKVVGEVNLYNLPDNILNSRYISNRPFLPTTLYEQNVDYRLETSATGQAQVRFSKDFTSDGFSTRLLSDEVTKEYAMWFVDSEIDEGWMSTYYASLIGVAPEASTDAFKNFVYGLYYVYVNGPTMGLIKKGLNLCLGVPLARAIETVLEVRNYLQTDQQVVITNQNQYIIPFGLQSSVAVGQTLAVGDELAQWVEVKDYINDGEWWINIGIPPALIPNIPAGQINRYATAGSHYDYIMRTYLKKHTFLVNIKVTTFKDTQVFQQLSEIIKRVKPSYTEAIYIWTIPAMEDDLTLDDLSGYSQIRSQSRCENIILPIDKMHRDNSVAPLLRGCPIFIRYNVPNFVSRLCGTDPYINGDPLQYEGTTATGFINPNAQYRANTPVEIAWLSSINERGSQTLLGTRGKIGFSRGTVGSSAHNPYPVHPIYNTTALTGIAPGMKVIPLYLTTQADVVSKCLTMNITPPDMSQWMFTLLNPAAIDTEINSLAINEGVPDTALGLLASNYYTIMSRSSNVSYLSNVVPDVTGFQSYIPPGPGSILPTDYILGIRVYDNVVGIYWITTNTAVSPDPYFKVLENDPLTITMTAPPSRGLGPTSSSFYLTRDRANLDYNTDGAELNGLAINESANLVLTTSFSDMINVVPMQIVRDGTAFNHMTELN